ncbi:PAS domain-containing protein, partial [Mycobacterium tuberculosis]|nr:PAS domain-containing protein [Mycobacterium tuberculosis]
MLAAFLSAELAGLLIRHEQERRQREQTGALLRRAVDTLPDCLSIKDLDGRFVAANRATAALLRAPDVASIIGA